MWRTVSSYDSCQQNLPIEFERLQKHQCSPRTVPDWSKPWLSFAHISMDRFGPNLVLVLVLYMFLPCIPLSFRNTGFDAFDLTRAKACGSPLVLGTTKVRTLEIMSHCLCAMNCETIEDRPTTGPFRSDIGADVEGFRALVWVPLVAMMVSRSRGKVGGNRQGLKKHRLGVE